MDQRLLSMPHHSENKIISKAYKTKTTLCRNQEKKNFDLPFKTLEKKKTL